MTQDQDSYNKGLESAVPYSGDITGLYEEEDNFEEGTLL